MLLLIFYIFDELSILSHPRVKLLDPSLLGPMLLKQTIVNLILGINLDGKGKGHPVFFSFGVKCSGIAWLQSSPWSHAFDIYK